MKIREILLVENYSLAQREFVKGNKSDEVSQYINLFKQLLQKNQISGTQEKNINYWRGQGFEAFKKFVNQKKTTPTARDIKQARNEGTHITLFNNDTWLVEVVLDHEASCHFGRNTNWCTTKPYNDKFARYFYDEKSALVYIINLQTQQKWAVVYNPGTIHHGYIFDYQNNEIGDTTLQKQTDGVWSRNQVEKLITPYRDTIKRARTKTAKTDITIQMDKDIINPNLEQKILAWRHATAAAEYAIHVKKSAWPEAEGFIARNGMAATQYARYILKQPWPKAEPAIARDPKAAGLYVATVTHQRWPEAEPAILQNIGAIGNYLFGLGWPKWREAEHMIMKDSELAAKYAMKSLKHRWPEAEATIQKDPYMWREYREYFKIET